MFAEDLAFHPQDRVLLLGAIGFVGSGLISELSSRQIKLRLFVRNIQKAAPLIPDGSDTELFHPLIEGLKNKVIYRDNRIDSFVKITKTSFKEAVQIAFSEEKDGPGITGV